MIDNNLILFTFDMSSKHGAVLKFYNIEICKFIKMNYTGLNIKSSYEHIVNFSIDKKLYRKLKLLSVTNNTKHNSKEELILSFIEKSIIVDSTKDFHYPDSYFWYTNIDDNLYKKEMDMNCKVITNKMQSKMYSQKTKQYNNNRIYRK